MKHLIKYTDNPFILHRVYFEIDIAQWSRISQNEWPVYMYITYNLLFYLDHVYKIDGVTRPGGLLGLLVRVNLSSGVTICNVKVSR